MYDHHVPHSRWIMTTDVPKNQRIVLILCHMPFLGVTVYQLNLSVARNRPRQDNPTSH